MFVSENVALCFIKIHFEKNPSAVINKGTATPQTLSYFRRVTAVMCPLADNMTSGYKKTRDDTFVKPLKTSQIP